MMYVQPMEVTMNVPIPVSGLLFAIAMLAQPAGAATFTSFDAPCAGGSTPPGQGTYATSINAGGAIAGYCKQSNLVAIGYVRAANGTFKTFEAIPGGSAPGQGTYPAAINAAGVTTGWFVDASGVNHGFLLLPDNNIGVINVPGAGTNGHYGQGTVANSINDAGLISGYYLDAHNVFHGFVRAADAIITTFDAKGAATGFKMGTLASSINSAGVITGTFMTPDSVTHGFVRTADGVITGFDGPMAGFTSPVSINAAGVITASTECRVGLNKDSSALQMGPLRLLMFHRDSAPIPRASTRPGLSRVSTPITMELPASSAAPGRGPSPRSRLPSPAPQTP